MNLILLKPEQLQTTHYSKSDQADYDSLAVSQSGSTCHFKLDERQSTHCIEVLNIKEGDRVRVGILNKNMGDALCSFIDKENQITLTVNQNELNEPPPPATNIQLYLALPRPKMLRRIFRTIAECGIKKITLINSTKVEKSYWQTPSLNIEKIQQYFLEGLEQAKDTLMPSITIENRFRPFVEDKLSQKKFDRHNNAWVAHPYKAKHNLADVRQSLKSLTKNGQNLHLMVGPEGGFTAFEIAFLNKQGIQSFSTGPRIFRSETFVSWVLGALESA